MKRIQSRREFAKAAAACGLGWAALPGVMARPRAPAAKFQPTRESLRQYRVPAWYLDAKLGIFIHWGVYSVPAYSNEWYPREMYLKDSDVYKFHRAHFGPQSTFGYKDFIPRFTASRWEPERWVELFHKAGAKYIVPVGEHHDGFPMYRSSHTSWNAAQMGPRRDVVGELARAARKHGLKLGVSSHRAFNWSYYTFDKDFDTSNPEFSGLYGKPHSPTPLCFNRAGELRQIPSQEFIEDWYRRNVEIAERYHPDLMWFDFCFECPEFESHRMNFAAYFYNQAERRGQEVVINYKHQAYPEDVAVLDIERGLLDQIRARPWQTDTSVSWKSWGYIEDDTFKSAGQLVRELVDIVSKNGCLLLNVGPRPDGTIPEEAERVLLGIGKWLEVNGEAVYGTRPWKVFGEGPTRLAGGYFGEKEKDAFTPQDIRFTTKGNALYAICLAWPGTELSIQTLGSASGAVEVSEVRMLGVDEILEFREKKDSLTIYLPGRKPCDDAYAFKILFKEGSRLT